VNNKITKIDYILKFFNLLDIEDNEVNRKKYLDFWWFNVRGESTQGLRLTKPGYLTITKELQLKEYVFDLNIDDYQGKLHLYLDLDHYLPSPYFIHSNKLGKLQKAMKISIFDEKLATMFYLSGQSLAKVVESMKISLNS
jgi:hypothetical protein